MEALEQFCLTILVVKATSHRYCHAVILDGEVTTVLIRKTREYAVKILKVRMNDKKIKHVEKIRQATKLLTCSADSVNGIV